MVAITSTLNLLLVEDDLEVQSNLKTTLGYIFKKIFVASDGEQALSIIHNEKVDLVISDYVLPKMNADEYITQLRSANNNLPIILLSSFIDMDKLQKCIPLNLVHFLEKPISFESLQKQIEISIKRLGHKSHEMVLAKNIVYNKKKNTLMENNNSIVLTALEGRFIEVLCQYQNEIVTYDMIINYLNSGKEELTKDSIKNIVYRLRKKTKLQFIKSHRSLGYSISI